MKKIGAVIHARMGSTRLPEKVLMNIEDRPMLHHIIQRLKFAENLDNIIVATTTNVEDQAIVDFCKENQIDYYAGSEDDVLDRYYQTADKYGLDVIVRITADCPVIDYQLVDTAIDVFLKNSYDHVSLDGKYPDGLDTEVFSFEALREAWEESNLKSEREHVTPYIWKNPDKFKLYKIPLDQDLSHLRWTVDEPEDIRLIREIYSELYDPNPQSYFDWEEIFKLVQEKPELQDINSDIARNEGYQKSLKEDEVV